MLGTRERKAQKVGKLAVSGPCTGLGGLKACCLHMGLSGLWQG